MLYVHMNAIHTCKTVLKKMVPSAHFAHEQFSRCIQTSHVRCIFWLIQRDKSSFGADLQTWYRDMAPPHNSLSKGPSHYMTRLINQPLNTPQKMAIHLIGEPGIILRLN